tara:strand:+ start:1540 stop:1746 length:207 start_codon:yes stop_codon:yes gene_type:complete
MTVLIENLFTYRERLTNGAQSFLANQSNETWADGAQDLINIICDTWKVEEQDLIVAIHDVKHNAPVWG